MKPLLIIGSGDHALVVEDIARALRRRLVGFVSIHGGEGPPAPSETALIGNIDEHDVWLAEHAEAEFVVAIGRNDVRKDAFERLTSFGLEASVILHPTAHRLGHATIGSGSQVCAGAVIGVAAVIGTNVIVNTAATIDHHDRIGDHAFVGPGAHLAGRVTVGEGAHVGIGAAVREGIRIGAWSYIAAGAVVVEDVPDGERWAGVPARPMRTAVGSRE